MYIFNGRLMNEDPVSNQALDLRFELQNEQTGEYCICLVGASSDSISLKEGTIYTEQEGVTPLLYSIIFFHAD